MRVHLISAEADKCLPPSAESKAARISVSVASPSHTIRIGNVGLVRCVYVAARPSSDFEPHETDFYSASYFHRKGRLYDHLDQPDLHRLLGASS